MQFTHVLQSHIVYTTLVASFWSFPEFFNEEVRQRRVVVRHGKVRQAVLCGTARKATHKRLARHAKRQACWYGTESGTGMGLPTSTVSYRIAESIDWNTAWLCTGVIRPLRLRQHTTH